MLAEMTRLYSNKKPIYLIFGIFFLFFGFGGGVFAAEFRFSPATGATFLESCEYSVDIILDTEGADVNAAEIEIDYKEVEILDADTGTSGIQISNGNAFSNYFGEVDDVAGTIKWSGFNVPPIAPFNGSFVFATIHFSPLVNPGTSTLIDPTFDILFSGIGDTLDSNIADYTTGNDLLDDVVDGDYTFQPSGVCPVDVIDPSVTFIYPSNGGTNIPGNSIVSLTVSDNSDVDLSSVQIDVNGSLYSYSDPEVLSVIPNPAPTSYRFEIDPADFPTDESVYIRVYAQDGEGNFVNSSIIFNVPESDSGSCAPCASATTCPSVTCPLVDCPVVTQRDCPSVDCDQCSLPSPSVTPAVEVVDGIIIIINDSGSVEFDIAEPRVVVRNNQDDVLVEDQLVRGINFIDRYIVIEEENYIVLIDPSSNTINVIDKQTRHVAQFPLSENYPEVIENYVIENNGDSTTILKTPDNRINIPDNSNFQNVENLNVTTDPVFVKGSIIFRSEDGLKTFYVTPSEGEVLVVSRGNSPARRYAIGDGMNMIEGYIIIPDPTNNSIVFLSQVGSGKVSEADIGSESIVTSVLSDTISIQDNYGVVLDSENKLVSFINPETGEITGINRITGEVWTSKSSFPLFYGDEETQDDVEKAIESFFEEDIEDVKKKVEVVKVVEDVTDAGSSGVLTVSLIYAFNLLAPYVGSLNSFGLLINFFSILVTGKRKYKPWGLVQDASNQSPISFALCKLYLKGTTTLQEQTLTDANGIYGFPITPGKYRLEVRKDGYDNYVSDLEVNASTGISIDDISMYPSDLVSKSDIEFGGKVRLKGFLKNFGILFGKIIPYLLVIGFLFSIFAVFNDSGWRSMLILCFYIVFLGLRILSSIDTKPRYASVVDANNNLRVPNALVKIYELKTWNLIDSKLTNNLGYFDFWGEPGYYGLSVSVKGYKFPSKMSNNEVVDKVKLKAEIIKLRKGKNNIQVYVDPLT